ncbi:hypothetical protein DO70_4112 [Burkholderia pseudomallei]|nr:hypothetical protein DO63_4886 [Burkholderia pseudomallei]KGD06388.1 hypothetical protein DO70_4112 [Burkholderia pseudomallei]KGS71296.1 hypothetical protein X990_2248 [Burkholderia pseudomallei MSHR4868]
MHRRLPKKRGHYITKIIPVNSWPAAVSKSPKRLPRKGERAPKPFIYIAFPDRYLP